MKTLACLLTLCLCKSIDVGDGFDLSWWTADGGGAMFSTGGGFELGGTIGQPDTNAPPSTGSGFELTGGFWAGVSISLSCATFAPADFDQDCDVDAADLIAFKLCASRSHVAYADGCAAKDLDHDGDVDMDDFGVFQRCYSGTGQLADPNCAN